MEKLRISAEKQSGTGLLKSFLLLSLLFFSQPLFSQVSDANKNKSNVSAAGMAALQVRLVEKMNFTNQDTAFILEIPGAVPADVQAELPSLPQGVNFISSRKSDYLENYGTQGTRIEFWFTFRNTGKINISPITVFVKGRRYSIPFEQFEIFENPQTILPRMIIDFYDGRILESDAKPSKFEFTAGEPVRFTVYLQYIVQIQQTGWIIPKESLFKDIKRYDITSNTTTRGNTFSPEKIPVADFEWVPLSPGETTLPEIRLKVTSYGGRSIDIPMPECKVKITGVKVNAPSSEEVNEPGLFSYAFNNPLEGERTVEKVAHTTDDYKKIAELRSLERNSLPFLSGVKDERIKAESLLGIKNAKNEPSKPLVAVFVVLFCLLFVASMILMLFAKKTLAVIILSLSGAVAVLSVAFAIQVKDRYGIITGGYINPIPEDSALTSSAVTGGNRVHILQEVQGWYYILYSESGGWIKKENLILIE